MRPSGSVTKVRPELAARISGNPSSTARMRAWSACWAGPIEQGAGHYYAISGPSVLIEYDNTQDDANHIHSVWRDLRRDFAGDRLARHYAEAPHPGGSV